MPLAGPPGAQPGCHQRLTLWRIVAIKRAELEQRDIGRAAIGVAPRGRYEPGQERGPHCIEIGADRVGETQSRLGAAKQRGLARRDKGERDRFDEAARGESAAYEFRPLLHPAQRRARQCRIAVEGDCRDLVVAFDPENFLDQIGLADDVAAPGGRLDREIVPCDGLYLKAECGQDRRTLLAGHVEAAKRRRTPTTQYIAAAPIGNGAGGHDVGGLPAAEVEHQLSGDLQPVSDKGQIEPAFEAIAGVARNVELAAGRTGSKSAASIKTSVVVSVHPVRSPPITPPRLCTPALSAIAVISASRAYSWPLRASRVSPDRAKRTVRSPLTRSASKTWSGRLRSKVRKLVMSTNVEIGRSPIASSRPRNHPALGPLWTPRSWRPRNSGQAERSSIRMSIGERKDPGTGVVSSGFSCPSPEAARSRAMPRTPRQSARFGVTLMSRTVSPRPA